MPLLGTAAWAGGISGTLLPAEVLATVGGCICLLLVALVFRRRPAALLVGVLMLVTMGAAAAAALRTHQVAHNPVSELGSDGAAARVVGTVTSDPRTVSGASVVSG